VSFQQKKWRCLHVRLQNNTSTIYVAIKALIGSLMKKINEKNQNKLAGQSLTFSFWSTVARSWWSSRPMLFCNSFNSWVFDAKSDFKSKIWSSRLNLKMIINNNLLCYCACRIFGRQYLYRLPSCTKVFFSEKILTLKNQKNLYFSHLS
jgi:hypothetical protein